MTVEQLKKIVHTFMQYCEQAKIDTRGHQAQALMLDAFEKHPEIDARLWYPTYLMMHWSNDVLDWLENPELYTRENCFRTDKLDVDEKING
jgi:hypothetical protein